MSKCVLSVTQFIVRTIFFYIKKTQQQKRWLSDALFKKSCCVFHKTTTLQHPKNIGNLFSACMNNYFLKTLNDSEGQFAPQRPKKYYPEG